MRGKILLSFFYLILASMFTSPVFACHTTTCPPAPKPSPFKIYIETNYKNQPDLLSKYGLEDMPIIYGQAFWKPGQDNQLLPSQQKVINVVKAYVALRASLGKPITKYLILDIEQFNLSGSDAQIKANVTKLVTMMNWAKLGVPPHVKVALYSTVPGQGGWYASQSPGSRSYLVWQHRSDLVKPIARNQAAQFPDFYPITDNQDTWKKVTTEHIKELNRISGNKPIYGLINPRYSSPALGGLAYKYIPKDYFLTQLNHLKAQGAAGVVIWGADLAAHTWDENRAWWVAVKEFLGLK